MFLRPEKKSDKDSRHKLAPIALAPYLVKQVHEKAKTAVIVYDDDTVENVSRSRIVHAPKQLSSAEVQSIVQHTVVSKTIANYPATEAVNLQHVLSKGDANANKKQFARKMPELTLKVHKPTKVWTKFTSITTSFSSTQ